MKWVWKFEQCKSLFCIYYIRLLYQDKNTLRAIICTDRVFCIHLPYYQHSEFILLSTLWFSLLFLRPCFGIMIYSLIVPFSQASVFVCIRDVTLCHQAYCLLFLYHMFAQFSQHMMHLCLTCPLCLKRRLWGPFLS